MRPCSSGFRCNRPIALCMSCAAPAGVKSGLQNCVVSALCDYPHDRDVSDCPSPLWRTLANGNVAHVPLTMLRDISSRILRKPLHRLDKGPVKVALFLACLSEKARCHFTITTLQGWRLQCARNSRREVLNASKACQLSSNSKRGNRKMLVRRNIVRRCIVAGIMPNEVHHEPHVRSFAKLDRSGTGILAGSSLHCIWLSDRPCQLHITPGLGVVKP